MNIYWKILQKYRGSLLLSPLLVFFGVLSETMQPYLMSKIIDNGVIPKDMEVITWQGIWMIAISLIGMGFSLINNKISAKTSTAFGTDLRREMFAHIQSFSFGDIDKFSTSSLITRLTNDISKIQQIVLMMMRIILRAPLMLVMALFFVLRINTQLALIMAISIPVMGLGIYLILSRAYPMFIKIQTKIDNLNQIVRENLQNMRLVKSFVREEFEEKKFKQVNEDLRDIVIKASNNVVTLFPLMQFVMNASVLAVLWLGGQKIMEGSFKVGELISFVNYFIQILMALMIVSMISMAISRAAASSKRIQEVLETKPSIINNEEGEQNKHQIKQGELAFHNVTFRYPGSENDVLKNISLEVKSGETIAVVGATGSAKSTMLQLIPRLYDASAGEVTIDGINVKDYNLKELHKKIGMVLQVNELFTGTIAENIRWGKPDATKDEIESVCKIAQAHDFIQSFELKYDTMIGRGGINVSGGQKQRICIARALLQNPVILILDDSTSAVDSDTEKAIRTQMKAVLKGTTTLIVTQRMNSMEEADRVIVFENGRIDSIGKAADLLQTSGVFREIYYSQQITKN